MGKETEAGQLFQSPRHTWQLMIINTEAKGKISAVACWHGYFYSLTYSVLDLVGKKEC